MDFLRLGLVFAVIVVALRRKVPVGVTLFAAGLLVALLFQVSVARLIEGYWQMVSSIRFLSLTGVIVFVTTLGQLLKSQGYLERLSGVFGGVWGGQKTAVMVLPAMVGLMPMPGGALLSAPLVGQAMADPKYSAEHRTATNYWFRHVVEFSWPIYPGLVLTEAITHVPMGQVGLLQVPMSLLMIIIGYFILVRRIDIGETRRAGFAKTTIGILGAVWPIGTAILIYGIFRWDLSVSVLISLILLILFTRPSRPELMVAVKEGFSYRLALMVFGILSFQAVLELSGAINSFPALATTYHLPPVLIICIVCFTVGILTGMTAAFVGLGYTLLAGFIYDPIIIPGNILLAYVSGYIGMMLAPSHLCLILTNQYFKSDLGLVYRRILPGMILLGLVGAALAWSPWPGFVVR